MKRNLWLCATVCLLALTGCTSFEDVKKQADSGNSDMQFQAAVMLMEGNGTAVDRKAAEKYLMSAFKSKNLFAACYVIENIYKSKQGDQANLLLEAYDILFAQKASAEFEQLKLLASYPADSIKYMVWLDKSGFVQSAFAVKKHILANINKCPLHRRSIYKYTLQANSYKTACEKAEAKRIAEKKAEEKRIAAEKNEANYKNGCNLLAKVKKYDSEDAAISLDEKAKLINQAQQILTEAMQQGHVQAAAVLVDLILYKQHPMYSKVLPFKDESELLISAWKKQLANKEDIRNIAVQIGTYSYYLGNLRSSSKLVAFARKYKNKKCSSQDISRIIQEYMRKTSALQRDIRMELERKQAAKRLAEEKRIAEAKRIAEEKQQAAAKRLAEEKQKDPKFKYPYTAISSKHIKLYKEFESGTGFKWFAEDIKIKQNNPRSSVSINLYYNLAGGITYNRNDFPGVAFVFGRDFLNDKNLLQCKNGPLFACSFSINNPSVKISDLITKFTNEYAGVKKLKQHKKVENDIARHIQGTRLQVKTILFTDTLESEDVKITIKHRRVETVFSEGARKLRPEEKDAIEMSLAYMKNQFNGFDIAVVDKKLAKHFAGVAKQAEQLSAQKRKEAENKAAKQALDF